MPRRDKDGLLAARYNSNGSLDTSFDGDGKVVIDAMPRYSDSASALAVNSNGLDLLQS